MKKPAIAGIATAALLAAGPVAVAQAPLVFNVEAAVTPSKAGTKSKPRNARIGYAFTVDQVSRKTVSAIELYSPREIRLDGTGFRFCTADFINRNQGPDECPAGSKLGQGMATATFGPALTPLRFTMTVFAAAEDEVALHVRSEGYGISVALPGPIDPAGRPFGQKVTVEIPEQLQKRFGAFAYLTGVSAAISGRTATRKGDRRRIRFFASSRGCPSTRQWTFGINLVYVANDAGPGGETGIVRAPVECRSSRRSAIDG